MRLLPLALSVRRLGALLAVGAVVAVSSVVGVAEAPPAQAEPSSEATLMSLLNGERTSRGLPALSSASDLVSVARYQSGRMSSSGTLFHNAQVGSMVSGWTSIGENVGYASSAAKVHAALMASAPHKANILSGTFRQAGIGTSVDGSGRLWITQVFRTPTPSAAPAGTAPIGRLDIVRNGLGTVRVAGWALDRDTSASIATHVYVDGRAVRSLTANTSRPDIGRLYGRGDRHGYATDLVLTEGRHTVCTYGINAAGTAGGHTRLGCLAVVVPHTPKGSLDVVRPGAGTVTAGGWALDPDTRNAIAVHVYVDGVARTSTPAAGFRSDIARLNPAYGGAHGYSATVSVSRGSHRVCTYAINAAGTPGGHRGLGCRTVTV